MHIKSARCLYPLPPTWHNLERMLPHPLHGDVNVYSQAQKAPNLCLEGLFHQMFCYVFLENSNPSNPHPLLHGSPWLETYSH